MRDHMELAKHIKSAMSIAPASKAAATYEGTAHDWTDGMAEVMVEIVVGAVASGASAVITLQQSSNNNVADAAGAADPYANINDAEDTPVDLSKSITSADANSIVKWTVQRRAEKYIRAKVVVSTDAIVLGINLHSVQRDNVV